MSPNTAEIECSLAVLEALSLAELEAALARPCPGSSDCTGPAETTIYNFFPFIKSMLDDVVVYSDAHLRSLFRFLL